jgi:hypothetical protein
MALRGHDGEVVSMALSPDGAHLLTGGYDRRVLLWESGRVSSNVVAAPPVVATRGRNLDAAYRRVVVDAHAGTGLWRNGEDQLLARTSRVEGVNQPMTDALLADQDLMIFTYMSDRIPDHPLTTDDVQRLASFVADGGALLCVGQSWSFAQQQGQDPDAAFYPLNTIGRVFGFAVLPAYAEPPYSGAVVVARDGGWVPSVLRLPASGDPVVWVRDAQGRPVAAGFDHGRGRVVVIAHEGLLEDNPGLTALVFAYLAPYTERLPVVAQNPVRLARLAVAPVIDGLVDPAEYGRSEPVAEPGTDNGFGDANHLGALYAAHDGERLYLGLRGASLDERMTNGIVVFISSPRISGGWHDPARGTDRGEVGDPPGQPVAEALITRGGRGTGGWALPGQDFADLAVAVVDVGRDFGGDGGRPPPRSPAGVYLLGSPCSANDLGFWPSRYAWRDRGPGGEGGLEAVVDFAFMGDLQPGDRIELVAFIARPDGYTSNETLPADLLTGPNPGPGLARFRPTTVSLIIGE